MLPKIDVPVYETTLISTGKKVKFRPFLVKEQKLFLMAAQSDDAKEVISIIKQVINNCIIGKVDIDSLPMFDLENLFIQLRARSVGEVVNLRYNCNNIVKGEDGQDKNCGALVKFDLNILEIQPEKNPEHTNKIELTKKLGIVMKYPTFEMIDKLNLQSGDMDKILDVVIGCIDYIYDENQMYYTKDTTKEEMVEFVENMQQADLEKMQKFFDTMPKFKKMVHFKCPKCKYEEDMVIEGIQNFFV